jgi:hypothetical protein
MWTVDDLHRAIERRNEHLELAPDVEHVILAIERASGRTEEIIRRDAARDRLNKLLAVLDADLVPGHVRNRYPVLPVSKIQAQVPVPTPLPAATLDKRAIIALLKNADVDREATNHANGAQRPKEVSLEPQTVKGPGKTHSGPSR